METQLLKNPDLFPSEEILKNTLGEIYLVYESLMKTVAESGLTHEWRYYSDGKAWLCKVVNKKKTVFWLSVWDSYFKISFFFTEKNLESIAALDIDRKIKDDFCRQKPAGKLFPMIFNMVQKEQLCDWQKVFEFKKKLR